MTFQKIALLATVLAILTPVTVGQIAEPSAEPSIADSLPADNNVVDPDKDETSQIIDLPGGGSNSGLGFNVPSWLSNLHDLDPCACCVAHAVCVNEGGTVQTCECREGFTGDGFFHCVNETENYYCEAKSDPALRTLGGENFVHHLIGSTRLAQLTTERHGGGQCYFWLWGWTQRIKGKYFYSGLSFRIDQVVPNGEDESRRGHVDAIGEAGAPYSWNVRIYSPDDPEPIANEFSSEDAGKVFSHDIGGCVVQYNRIIQDFMYFNIDCCGISFAIRQYHPDFHGIVPGFYLQVKKGSNPTYETWQNNAPNTEPLCLDHTKSTTVQDLIDEAGMPAHGRRDALTFHAVTNTALSEYPGAPDGLALLKILLRDCAEGKRDELFNLIKFFFDNPKFAKCLDGKNNTQVTNSIEGIEYAASLVCNEASDACEPLENLVTIPECQRVLTEFPQLEILANPPECDQNIIIHNDFTENQNSNGWFTAGKK